MGFRTWHLYHIEAIKSVLSCKQLKGIFQNLKKNKKIVKLIYKMIYWNCTEIQNEYSTVIFYKVIPQFPQWLLTFYIFLFSK